MKIYQKPVISDRSSSVLKINKDTFAELISESTDFFNFNFTFSISLKNSRKDPRQYDKVVITVKRKEDNYSDLFSNIASETANRVINYPLSTTPQKKFSNSPTKILPDKVSNKLYSGLNLVKDIDKKEQFIGQSSILINSLIVEAASNKYTLTELYAEDFKKSRKEARDRDTQLRNQIILDEKSSIVSDIDTNRIDPSSVLTRINSELCDITYPLSEESISSLSSESLFENPKLRMSHISSGNPPLFFDIVKYYLSDIQPAPAEDTSTLYEKRISTKNLDDISISHSIPIKKNNKNVNLEVRFDLYKIGSNIIDETFSTDLFLPSHVEAFNCISNPPEVKFSYAKFFQKNEESSLCNVTVIDREISKKIDGYNVYLKSIDAQGNVSPYEKISQLKNEKINEFQVLTKSKLSILRVIPLDSQNKESNTFTNIVIGPGYKSIGALTILPSHFGKNGIKIDVLNVPSNCISLSLYRRDCTDNTEGNFEPIETIKIVNSSNISTITDRFTNIGRVYEYYAIAICIEDNSKEEISVYSNFSVFKSSSGPSTDASINVNLLNSKFSTSDLSPSVSFDLLTSISKSENEKITQTLKDQLGELYNQFLNPATNSSSPLGEDSSGIPQYSNIFFHEVVRTNLNTSERETFDLVSDGTFIDNQETQKINNVKSINPNHSYVYQIFTYKKNPVEIFKKFVVRGIDNRGKEWFYLPYKWKQPVVKLGKLYPDDNHGIPVVDAYENFTSESFGLTAQYQIESSSQYYSIDQIDLDRIDVNTVRISWSSNNNIQEVLDSFVVMKVVNGIRSFVGRTCKNYIYHQLTDLDLGSIYYIVVPIMSEFDIDTPAYSETIYVSPEGLTPRVKVTSLSSKLIDDSSIKMNENIFNVEKNSSLLSSLKQKSSFKKI
jgi:hypothetical protein